MSSNETYAKPYSLSNTDTNNTLDPNPRFESQSDAEIADSRVIESRVTEEALAGSYTPKGSEGDTVDLGAVVLRKLLEALEKLMEASRAMEELVNERGLVDRRDIKGKD